MMQLLSVFNTQCTIYLATIQQVLSYRRVLGSYSKPFLLYNMKITISRTTTIINNIKMTANRAAIIPMITPVERPVVTE